MNLANILSQISGIIKGTAVPTPFVARSKEQLIKVRSTDTVSAYKRGRSYGAFESFGAFCYKRGLPIAIRDNVPFELKSFSKKRK